MQARDIMTTSVISVPLEGQIEDAVRLMLDHNISALPVVDAEGDLKGLVSEGDLMRRVRETDGPRRSWWLEVLG
ncbi:MAG: CBS domain-containing protein, partial [Sulfitobacter sp.]